MCLYIYIYFFPFYVYLRLCNIHIHISSLLLFDCSCYLSLRPSILALRIIYGIPHHHLNYCWLFFFREKTTPHPHRITVFREIARFFRWSVPSGPIAYPCSWSNCLHIIFCELFSYFWLNNVYTGLKGNAYAGFRFKTTKVKSVTLSSARGQELPTGHPGGCGYRFLKLMQKTPVKCRAKRDCRAVKATTS